MSATRKSERLAEKSQGRQEPKQLPTRRDSEITLDERDIIPDSPSPSPSGPANQTTAGQASTFPVSDVQSTAPIAPTTASGTGQDYPMRASSVPASNFKPIDAETLNESTASLPPPKEEEKSTRTEPYFKIPPVDTDVFTRCIEGHARFQKLSNATPGMPWTPSQSSDPENK